MDSPPEALDAALLSRPLSLSLSPQSPSLNTTSATTPTVLSTACGHQSSFAVSRALSEATTAAFPLPPVPRTATLQLLPNHSLPSLLAKQQPPFAAAARPLTASEAASELVSRGSCVQREEETMVDELLLETTQPFYGVPTLAATATSAEEVEDEDAEHIAATVAVEGSKDNSSSSRFSSPKDHRHNNSRPQGQRLARLDTSTRSDASESVETVESYDRQLRKIVSYELMSSPSLKLPNTAPAATAPLPQHLLSHCLHPVTQSDSRCFSNATVSTPTGSPVGTGYTAQTSFAMEPEEPRSLMHFPAFVGLLDTVRSHSARSARGGGGGHSASLRSNSKSRNGTSLQDTAVSTPLGPPVSLTAHLRKPSTTPATTTAEESTRGKRVPHGSLMADSSSHVSGGISGVFPALSLLTVGSASANPAAAAASGMAEALLSSVEVVAPCPTTPRSPREGSRSRRPFSVHTAVTTTPINTAASVSDVLCNPNFQPVGVNNASFTQSSMPFVPLPAPVPRHLYRMAQDGQASLEPMALEESGRRPSTSLIQAGDTPVHPSSPILIPNLPPNASVASINGSFMRRFGASLPPLSPQVSSGGNVQEANVPSPRRATSAVCANVGGRSGSSAFSSVSRRGTASSFSPTGSPTQRTPLLGRLFREPKGHQVRMWVRAGSLDTVPLPSNEQCDEHGS